MPQEKRDEIVKAENNVKGLAPLLDQPFDRESEIVEKEARLAEVEKDLMAEESETGEEAEERARKKKAELDAFATNTGGSATGFTQEVETQETPAEEEKETPGGAGGKRGKRDAFF